MAGGESYDARAMRDDELTVESLDGRAYLTLRARVAAAWNRLRRMRRPAWLTRRRVGGAALGLALVATFALIVTGLAGQWWDAGRLAVLWHFAPTYTRTTIHASAPGTLTAVGAWERIPLPPTDDRMDALITSPSDPQAALACTGPQSDPKTLEPMDGPITLWRTRDGGQHWQPVALPAVTGTYCIAQVAKGAPERLALVVNGAGGCQTNHAFFSTDGGQHWRALSPPLPPQPAKMQSCALQVAVTPRHVYASAGITVLASTTTTHTSTNNGTSTGTTYNYQTTTWNTRSDDDGHTWAALTKSETPPQVMDVPGNLSSADGQKITQAGGYIQQGHPPTLNTQLWVSYDEGASWQPEGSLAGFYATRLTASPGVTLENTSASKPAYAVSGEGSNWTILHVQIAQLSGRTWAPLPPLPVAGASAEHMGVTFALRATPDGKLLVLGLGPHETISGEDSSQSVTSLSEWLWEWDPVAARWSAVAPIPPDTWPSRCADHCWRGEVAQGAGPQGNGAYLWLTSSDSASVAPTVLRLRLPQG